MIRQTESNTPYAKLSTEEAVLRRRNEFIADLGRQIIEIAQLGDAAPISLTLVYKGQRLDLQNDDNILTASTAEDLLDQIEAIKLITTGGGLDDVLTRASESEMFQSSAAETAI